MNWFIVVAGLLYFGGAITELLKGNFGLMGIYLAYMVANFILAFMK